jgi:peptide methionine sulfoxide reductase msrA/msrB
VKHNKLTKEEERVIIYKGTESPFSGKYNDYWEKGTYICKWCNAQLYRSKDKFDAGCGWPSFDDEIPNAVKRIPDPDGVRTEIVCANCGAHLGHVFVGESFTKKDVRHCVNSISLDFVPAKKEQLTEKAIFAGGCFWGTEYYFKRAKGAISTTVGYIGGRKDNPTYEQVCHTDTGHAEAVEVVFDPDIISYEELVKLFFEIHDPTEVNRQGPDIGEQYRSEVFYLNDEQKAVAERLIRILKDKGYKIATKVTKASTFWKAEEYHQNYYNKTGGSPYCHRYTKRF